VSGSGWKPSRSAEHCAVVVSPQIHREISGNRNDRLLALRYVHVPVSLKNLAAEQVDQFRREMQSLPGPVYVHCRGGTRAGTLVAINDAVQAGDSGEQALTRAAEIGTPCETPELRSMVVNYVTRHFEAGD
jgi:protein tyrosine phosphatase (PTP) superfamily phosphohydrolase (DUF442 family)